MFLLLCGRHFDARPDCHRHGVSIHSFINLSGTLFRITREYKSYRPKSWRDYFYINRRFYPRFLTLAIKWLWFLFLMAWQWKPICFSPEICEPGEYTMLEESGIVNCLMCPIGTYQPKFRGTECLSCPSGKTTARKASTSVKDCQ